MEYGTLKDHMKIGFLMQNLKVADKISMTTSGHIKHTGYYLNEFSLGFMNEVIKRLLSH